MSMHARRTQVLHVGANSKIVLAELTRGWKGLQAGAEVVLKTGPLTLNETDLLMRSDHPNVLKALDVLPFEGEVADAVGDMSVFESDDVWVASVLPKADSDLVARISPKNPVPLVVLYQVALGLAYLHRGGVIHADIKPANVLMFGNRPVLADFGASQTVGLPRASWPQSSGYKPPEGLTASASDKFASSASDVWALGMLIIYAVSGAHPYGPTINWIVGNECKAAAVKMTSDPKWTSEPGFYREGYAGLVPLIMRMMAPRAGDRPTMEEVLEDPAWDPVRYPRVITRELRAPPDGRGDISDAILQAFDPISARLGCPRRPPDLLDLAQQMYDRCTRGGDAAELTNLPELCIRIALDYAFLFYLDGDFRDDVINVCGRLGWKIVED